MPGFITLLCTGGASKMLMGSDISGQQRLIEVKSGFHLKKVSFAARNSIGNSEVSKSEMMDGQ